MSNQRVISESTGLYRLSIVKKQENNTADKPLQDDVETPKKGLPLAVPLGSPTRIKHNNANGSPTSISPSPSSSQLPETLLYELASKRRQVVELRQRLAQAEKDLQMLEEKCMNASQAPNDKIQIFTKKLQRTFQDVNNNPTVLKSRQSISNFFNAESNEEKKNEGAKSLSNTNLGTRPSFLQLTASRLQNLKDGKTDSPLLNRLRDKFNEFTVNEEEEEEFDKREPQKEYYLKDKMDYDDDEEISDGDDVVSKETENESDFEDGDVVVSTFKRVQ